LSARIAGPINLMHVQSTQTVMTMAADFDFENFET
jgi:hypothetical protein